MAMSKKSLLKAKKFNKAIVIHLKDASKKDIETLQEMLVIQHWNWGVIYLPDEQP